MKKTLSFILIAIIIVCGLSFALWLTSPDHTPTIIYACEHSLIGCDDGSSKIYISAKQK